MLHFFLVWGSILSWEEFHFLSIVNLQILSDGQCPGIRMTLEAATFTLKTYIKLPVCHLRPCLHAQLATDGGNWLEVSKILCHVDYPKFQNPYNNNSAGDNFNPVLDSRGSGHNSQLCSTSQFALFWLYSAGTEYMEAELFQSQLRYGAVVSRHQVNNLQWTELLIGLINKLNNEHKYVEMKVS